MLCQRKSDYADDEFLRSFREPLLAQLPKLEHRLDRLLAQLNRHGRLGSYYEQLWICALTLHPDYRLLAKDLLISRQRRTLGALDLLVEHRPSGEQEHWELAIKFYLGTLDTRDSENWIGPGRQDCLQDKLKRLEQHQLPLLRAVETQRQLRQRGWQVGRQRIILQGRLYRPSPEAMLPDGINPACAEASWVEEGALPTARWRTLARIDWLAGRPPSLLPRHRPGPPLAWPLHLINENSLQRIFVVPAGWATPPIADAAP
ncbi:hypothetical protein GCM10025772_06230 [Ferrimonas gelatinilytica]|uniref:DUF1853 family protein n=2 Tax=Ferrimonas gelatinilytica TaxID=1255257 RepID=A0ABP9RWD2_9GAMM